MILRHWLAWRSGVEGAPPVGEAANRPARQRCRGEPASTPVVRLNRVVQYLLPDQVVTALKYAWQVERDEYWLTALVPIQIDLLAWIVAAWLRQAFPGDGEVLAARLDPEELVWEGPVLLGGRRQVSG